MTPPNPSEAAREAANETLANIMRKHIEDAARAEALAARLQAELTAERERRVAAEEVINKLCDDNLGLIAAWQVLTEYRTKFPKGDDHG